MNKLISRNPVLRFKQGRKIVKAEKGVRFQRVGSTWFPGLKSSTMEYVFYDHNTGDYITSTKPEITSLEGTINRGKSYSKYGYSWKEKEFARTPNSTSKPRDYSFMKGGTNQRSPEAEALLKDKKVLKYLKRQESLGFTAKPTPKKVITPTPQKVTTPHFQSLYKNLMQQRGITADQIIEWQNKLKDFYDPNAKYKSADGIWGLDTEAAYLRYLSSKNIPTYTKAELTDDTPATPTTPTVLEKPVLQNDFASQKLAGYPSSLSIGEQLFNNIILRPEFKYGYSNYRNFNPFKFDLRPMYKQGGQLPPRNIVERFKIRKGLFGLISALRPKKNKKVEKSKDEFGNDVVTTIIENRGKNPFKTGEIISLEVTYDKENPEYNDTVYTYLPQQYISLNPKYETSNNWKTAGVSLRRSLFERLRNIFNNLNGTPKFKNFRLVPVTTLKTGGNIPKLQTAWQPINWNDNNKFVDQVVSNVAKEAKKAKKVVENQRKANNVANRKTKVPGIDNTAKLQLALYDNGFFKGVIDKKRTGKQVTLERAVDGYMGSMTNLAIQNAKKAGYIVNVNTGEIKLPKKKELAYGKRPKLQPEQLQASTFSFENAKNKGKELLSRIFGDKDIITGRNEQLENAYLLRYNTPYSLDIDRGEPMMKTYVGPDGFISYQLVEGPDGRPVYTSKVGSLGLFNRLTDDKGRVCYQIKNDKGEIVTRCSETGNLINRSLGLPTTGDAWTRLGVYGDSLIYGGIDHNKIYTRPVGKVINGLRPDLLDPNNLKTGDFVDLYTEGSGHNSEAALGRGNSHTGTIYKPLGDNGPVYIIHGGLGDKVYVDPLDRFGPLSTWSIMGVRRPGSKEHPYYKEDI